MSRADLALVELWELFHLRDCLLGRIRMDPVGLAEECDTALEFERRVLERFEREVGCDVAFFSVLGREASPSVMHLDEQLIARAVTRGAEYASELMPVKRAAFARRKVAVDTEVLGWEQVRKAKYHREIASKVGGRHSLFAYLTWHGRPTGMVMLGRTGGAFSSREVERVEAVVVALGVARAAYGLPVPCGELPRVEPHWLERMGLRGERVLGSLATPRGTISVRDRGGFREMVAASGRAELVWSRAALHDPCESGWPYVELFHVAAARARRRERALFVGLGGAVAVRQFARTYPGIRCDVVECEPAVVALAREFFALDAIPQTSVHIADGAEFIARAAAGSWDIVVIDAYDAADMGAAFSTPEFFAALRRALAPGGAVALNVIGTLAGNGPVERSVRAAERELEDVRILPVTTFGEKLASHALRNVVIVALRPA